MSEESTNITTATNEENLHEQLVKKGDKVAVHFTYWFAWFWGIVSVVYFYMVTFISIPPAGENFANIILGFLLGTAVSTIINYFFGSSDT
jgi:hypothetical protein